MAYGIAASRAGFDVKTCADFEKVYDSRWKCLKIEYQGSYTVAASASVQTIYTHSLGYAPFFWAFVTTAFGDITTLAISEFQGFGGVDNYSSFIRCDSTSLVFDNTSGFYNGDTIYFYIFVDQINEAIAESKLNTTGTTLLGGTGYGIKISKTGFNVNTAAPKDLVLSSEYATLQINQVSTGSHNFTGGALTISHTLGYVPQFYFYVRDLQGDGRWEMIGNNPVDVGFKSVKASSSNCVLDNIGLVGTKDYSLIILKDPIT